MFSSLSSDVDILLIGILIDVRLRHTKYLFVIGNKISDDGALKIGEGLSGNLGLKSLTLRRTPPPSLLRYSSLLSLFLSVLLSTSPLFP